MVKIKLSEIKTMVEGIYYSSNDKTMHWEPFEYYEPEQVQIYVDSDIDYWEGFLKRKGIEIEEDI